MKQSQERRVLVVLGRIGRFWGSERTIFDSRMRAARELVCRRYQDCAPGFDQVVFTGGIETVAAVSNAELAARMLGSFLRGHPLTRQARVDVLTDACRNQDAIICVIDAAHFQWPDENIIFYFVTSAYAKRRMKKYARWHIRRLAALHTKPSPRSMVYRVHTDHVRHPSVRTLVRERAKSFIDQVKSPSVQPRILARD